MSVLVFCTYKLIIVPIAIISFVAVGITLLLLLFRPSVYDLNNYDNLYNSFKENLILQSCVSGLECIVLDLFFQSQENFGSVINHLNFKRTINSAFLGVFIHAPLSIVAAEYVNSTLISKKYQADSSSSNIWFINQVALVFLYIFYLEILKD